MYSATITTTFSPSTTGGSALPLPSSNHTSFFGTHQLKKVSFPNQNTRALPMSLPSIQAKVATRRENRIARHERVRKKVEGTTERPRMSVFRSNKHIYVQVIDDTKMHTLAAVSTMQKVISEGVEFTSSPTIEVAKKIGETIAKSCLEKGITKVTFDRGGYPYHGRIQAIADAARENGLEF